MTKDEASNGPLYRIVSGEGEGELPKLCTMEILTGHRKGERLGALAEFVRLANADAEYGERSRAAGDYDP